MINDSDACPDTPARQRLSAACELIAPSWPLDALIAVNPFWHFRNQPFDEVAARLATLGRVQCYMPGSYYRSLWQKPVQAHHLSRAAHDVGAHVTLEELLSDTDRAPPRYWYNVSDLVDGVHQQVPSQRHSISWHEEIIHQMSQFCGDLMRTRPGKTLSAEVVYTAWLDATRADRGLAILMREPALQGALSRLPNSVDELFAEALADLAPDNQASPDYALALLLDINGWAASFAWLRWQARLNGEDNDAIEGLLAIRLAWDWLLWQLYSQNSGWAPLWRRQWTSLPTLVAGHAVHQQCLLVWQRAAELAYQGEMLQALSAPLPDTAGTRNAAPVLQAAFCIDVRSEPLRRALEAQYDGIETIGFAGFFGLPLAYQPAGTRYRRAQLPGLLAPAITVTETQPAPGLVKQRERQQRWARFASAAPTTFTAVESGGLLYVLKLLRQSFLPGPVQHPVNDAGSGNPDYTLRDADGELSSAQQAQLALSVITGMGLRGRLAPRVLLVGHGSETCNNPHGAGLDCGACGGQTGEVNVRVLAQMLNDPEVRDELARLGESIPQETRFIAALHNTTTDTVRCFPAREDDLDDTVRGWLARASDTVRRERAPALGLDGERADLARLLDARSRDWSQVRPEWGLAGNASFIIAPRQRTRHLDLKGRSFLHDYRWQDDTEFALLELLMTAPMIVTNWINMQYNASTTDNGKLGCGNKALHNVVGGNLGVFEGNGGDLRIGLPLQSVHDGQRWMHAPLRLSVFIAAPEEAIAAIYRRHDMVRELVDNQWLYLFRLGDQPGVASRLYQGVFHAVVTASSASDHVA